MHRKLPVLAVILSVGGLIPFIVCGVAALQADRGAALFGVRALVGYAAMILGFLGGVHWGFALDDEMQAAQRPRLLLGTLPGIAGWLALVLSLVAEPWMALALLIATLIACTATEARGAARGFVPAGYMVMRWALSVTVLAILTAVAVLRLLGAAVAL